MQEEKATKAKSKFLSTQPYKGARDFFPEDMKIRNYIFDVWKKVCRRYGFLEYDGPIIEDFEIYAAKSGTELVNEQLYSFTDRGDRKVAIRPEMTPTVARMVAQKYKELNKPVRWFSIPNCYRYEKPQRGRGREFFQLNADIFGVDQIYAEVEIISMVVDIMKEFGASKNMFELRFSSRTLWNDFCDSISLEPEKRMAVSKVIDKKSKVTPEEFSQMLDETGISVGKKDRVQKYIVDPVYFIDKLKDTSKGAKEIFDFISLTEKLSLVEYIRFDTTIVRGLDYYTGIVFEQFDMNPKNNRAMFGGGRYDNLLDIFSNESVPAVGFGFGDITLIDFLESWELMPKNLESDAQILICLASWNEEVVDYAFRIASNLRSRKINTQVYIIKDTKLDKQLKFASNSKIPYCIIVGDNEVASSTLVLKNMVTGEQQEKPLNSEIF